MKTYLHDDGRYCRYLAYALDTEPDEGLRWAFFYGLPPDMRRCHYDHPEPEDISDDPSAD